jgi:hypothetical protein
MVVDLLSGMSAEVRSVTLYTKPRTILTPDYAWRETDRWIDFPWSSQPVVEAARVTDSGELSAH